MDVYWFLLFYLLTVSIETPILCLGLAPEHPWSRRVFCGFWLTACTYPIVWWVVPEWFSPNNLGERAYYLLVAESIAHFGECGLFYVAFGPLKYFWRDMATVFAANLASFGLGEIVYYGQGMYDVTA